MGGGADDEVARDWGAGGLVALLCWDSNGKGKNSRQCDEGHVGIKDEEVVDATNRTGGSAERISQRAEEHLDTKRQAGAWSQNTHPR